MERKNARYDNIYAPNMHLNDFEISMLKKEYFEIILTQTKEKGLRNLLKIRVSLILKESP